MSSWLNRHQKTVLYKLKQIKQKQRKDKKKDVMLLRDCETEVFIVMLLLFYSS